MMATLIGPNKIFHFIQFEYFKTSNFLAPGKYGGALHPLYIFNMCGGGSALLSTNTKMSYIKASKFLASGKYGGAFQPFYSLFYVHSRGLVCTSVYIACRTATKNKLI